MSKICAQLEKNRIKIMELMNKNIELHYQLRLDMADEFVTKEVSFMSGDRKSVKHVVKFAVIHKLRKTIPIEIGGVKCDENLKPIKHKTINDIP